MKCQRDFSKILIEIINIIIMISEKISLENFYQSSLMNVYMRFWL